MSDSVKNTRKANLKLSDLIGPLIAIENILILIFYFLWNFILDDKPGLISYLVLYLLITLSIVLVVLSLLSLFKLINDKEKISKSLKRDKIAFSIVGIILGLILVLFTNVIMENIGNFSEPMKYCDDSIIRDINFRIGEE